MPYHFHLLEENLIHVSMNFILSFALEKKKKSIYYNNIWLSE